MHETVTKSGRSRLERYPQRLRARLAGRVVRVKISAPGAPPRYEAEIMVEKSRPLPPAKTHPMTGMALADVTDEDLDSTDDISVEQEELPASDFAASATATAGFILAVAVKKEPDSSGPLYPDYPPLARGERVLLIWHGQKTVPGIQAGVYLRCSGMLSTRSNPATIYNPRYEIVQNPPAG